MRKAMRSTPSSLDDEPTRIRRSDAHDRSVRCVHSILHRGNRSDVHEGAWLDDKVFHCGTQLEMAYAELAHDDGTLLGEHSLAAHVHGEEPVHGVRHLACGLAQVADDVLAVAEVQHVAEAQRDVESEIEDDALVIAADVQEFVQLLVGCCLVFAQIAHGCSVHGFEESLVSDSHWLYD